MTPFPGTTKTIRRKLMSVVLVTTLAALLINGFALIVLEFQDYRESQLAAVRTQADILARASAAAVAFNDRKEALEALRVLRDNPEVFGAAIYRQTGELFAVYARDHENVPSTWNREGGLSFAGDRIRGFVRVVEAGVPIGAVFIDVHYNLYGRLVQFSGILVVVLLGALLLAVFLSAALQRSITGPIQDITEAARRVIDRHDYSVRVPKRTEDETALLAEAFNQMLAEIDRRSRDVDAQMRERQQAEDALRLADRRKDEFLATLAHELRNPLAPVRNAVELLRLKQSADPDVARSRDVIARQVSQMARLLDDLLDVSRITRNRLELRRQAVTLDSIVDSAVETSRPLLDAARHELDVSVPQQMYIDGDPTRLAQVFANLLNNAAKYTPRGGTIRLSAERTGEEVVVSVTDNGIGFAPEARPHLFEMFSQATPALERSQGGLGIGLSLVKALVEMHGGSVDARSDGHGTGSEFIVRLPVMAPDSGFAATHAGASVADGADRKWRVLVVDDLKDAADSLAALLETLGHEAHVAYDGEQGVGAARRLKPEVVFLDLGMPKINGYDACRTMRSDFGNDIFLVALTGWGQDDDRRRSAAAGFDRHLVKPVEPAALGAMLASLPEVRARSAAQK